MNPRGEEEGWEEVKNILTSTLHLAKKTASAGRNNGGVIPLERKRTGGNGNVIRKRGLDEEGGGERIKEQERQSARRL